MAKSNGNGGKDVGGTQSSDNAAAVLVKSIQSGKARSHKGKVEGLEDDDEKYVKKEVEFVHSKDSRAANRKWASAQEQKGNLPKQSSAGTSAGLRAIVILCSTLGAILFCYRMYLTHWLGAGKQYYIYTQEQLAVHNSDHRKPWIAIAGEVYDVSRSMQYYGKDGGYSFFAGRDASRAYLTGDFKGDLNDDVSDFTDAQMAGLSHWKDFYLSDYKYVGRVVGAFFDERGNPTPQLRRVWEGTVRHKAAEEERKNKRLAYPSCSKRWSSEKGSEIWCDDDMYPRKLTEMVGGIAEQRCACFKEMGWSSLRALYPNCSPEAHRCNLKPVQVEEQNDEL